MVFDFCGFRKHWRNRSRSRGPRTQNQSPGPGGQRNWQNVGEMPTDASPFTSELNSSSPTPQRSEQLQLQKPISRQQQQALGSSAFPSTSPTPIQASAASFKSRNNSAARSRRSFCDADPYNLAERVSLDSSFGGSNNFDLASVSSQGKDLDSERLAKYRDFLNSHYSQRLAIQVVDGMRWTGRKGKKELDNINMNVKQGTIYTLLGASNSGKSALLSCIIGMKKLNSGSVFVFGQNPGSDGLEVPGRRIGFMPEMPAIYFNYSTKEMAFYFGLLYGMKPEDIASRFDYLFSVLDLPCPNRRIKKMDLGEQKKVSFLISLIHSPDLLILDHPTAGVDALVRESIWSFLKKLVADTGTTVVITARCSEEALRSDKVGLMREGRLIIESEPQSLLEQFSTKSMEEAVVQLCLKDRSQNNEAKPSDAPQEVVVDKEQPSPEAQIQQEAMKGKFVDPDKPSVVGIGSKEQIPPVGDLEGIPNSLIFPEPQWKPRRFLALCRLKTLLAKNLLMMLRHWFCVLPLIVAPALLVLLWCTVVGHDPIQVRVGVVNFEKPDTNCLSYPKNDYKTIPCLNNEPVIFTRADFSCQFLAEVDRDRVKFVSYDTEEQARDAVEKGYSYGYLKFPVGFSENLWQRLEKGFAATDQALTSSSIYMRFDVTNKLVSQELISMFQDAMKNLVGGFLSTCKVNPVLAQQPLVMGRPIYGGNSVDFREYVVPAILLASIFFFPMCITSYHYIHEKKRGILTRELVAGVKIWEIIFSFFMTQMIVLVFQIIFVGLVAIFAFNIEMQGCYGAAVSLIFAVGICGLSYGFLVASYCKKKKSAIVFAMTCSFFPSALLSGMMWPMDGMPVGLRYFAFLFPQAVGANSLRGIVSRGLEIDDTEVWVGFLVTFLWTVVYVIWTIYFVKFSRSRK